MMGLWGAQEVTFFATLESSSECSRWRTTVVLFFNEFLYFALRGHIYDLRFGNHVCLEEHLIQGPFIADKLFLVLREMQSPSHKVVINSEN